MITLSSSRSQIYKSCPMPEHHSIEKIRRQAELLKSDKTLNLEIIMTTTSFLNDILSVWKKFKLRTKEKITA